MAFQKAVIDRVSKIRNAAGAIIGFRFAIEIYDTTVTETRHFAYVVTDLEFAQLPAGAAAKKAALLVILKREIRKVYDAWIAERAVRPQPPVVGDPLTDLGATEITNLD